MRSVSTVHGVVCRRLQFVAVVAILVNTTDYAAVPLTEKAYLSALNGHRYRAGECNRRLRVGVGRVHSQSYVST